MGHVDTAAPVARLRENARAHRKLLIASSTALYLCLAYVAAAPSPAYAQTEVTNFNVPAQPLRSALLAYSAQSKVQIAIPDELVEGKNAPAVSGALSNEQALQRLLGGSGLSYEFLGTRAAKLIEPQKKTTNAAPSAAPAIASNVRPALAVSSQPLEELIVTGTRIRGSSPSSPIMVIDRSTIELSGYSNVPDLIRNRPESFGGGQNSTVVGARGTLNNNANYGSTANLRGLGPGATLALVNGHRLTASGSNGNAGDISVIPLAAVDRIEILTDGASALYGSDAVAGVVNFKLRKNFDGFQSDAGVGVATQGGGFEQHYDQLGGVTWGSGSLLANLDYRKIEAVDARDRDISSAAGKPSQLTPNLEQQSGYVRVEQQVTDAATAFGEFIVSHRNASLIATQINSATIYTKSGNSQYSANMGMDVQLPGSWLASIVGSLGRESSFNSSTNALVTGVRSSSFSDVTNSARSLEVTADGSLLALPTGDVKLASGVGYREQSYNFGAPSRPVATDVSRHNYYAFAELQAPLITKNESRVGLQRLELTLAGRYERYSDVGHTTNPKFGVVYQPLSDLVLRSSWGTSFRAPDFPQQYGPATASLSILTDPQSPTGRTTALFISGVNPNLKPETAKTWTAGFDYRPTWASGLSVSASYYRIDYTDRILAPISAVGPTFTDPQYAPLIVRSPSAALQQQVLVPVQTFVNSTGAPYNPATVGALVSNYFQNVASLKVDGFDVSAEYVWDHDADQWRLYGSFSHLNYAQKLTSASPVVQISGTVFNPPRVKATAGAAWSNRTFGVSALLNYVGAETDNTQAPTQHVSSWTTINTQMFYANNESTGVLANTKLTISIENAFDRQPPSLSATVTTLVGYGFDSTNHSPLGRVIRAQITKRW